jgi:PncC family amidohydrolase
LSEDGLTISVAESCTGGLLASRITDVAGASAYFLGGVVAYQNDVKERLLAIPRQVLAKVGAVSEETAWAMARGCRELFGSDIGVSITGIAGPSGGTAEKPVGLVYIAVEGLAGRRCERFCWAGDRTSNKESSVRAALEMILSLLAEENPLSVEPPGPLR